MALAAAQTGKLLKLRSGVNTDTPAATILATQEIRLATVRQISNFRPLVLRELHVAKTVIIIIPDRMDNDAITIAIPA